MARYIARVRTGMPANEAFAYIADFRNFANWDPGVVRSLQIAGERPGSGSKYEVTVDNGRLMTLVYEVVEYVAPRTATVVADGPWFRSIDRVDVHPTENGSEVVYDATLELPWYLRPGDILLRRVFNRIGDKAAAGLETALDGTLVG